MSKLKIAICIICFLSYQNLCSQKSQSDYIIAQIAEADALRNIDSKSLKADSILASVLPLADSLELDSISLILIHDLITINSLQLNYKRCKDIYSKYLKTPEFYLSSIKDYKSVLLLCFQSERVLGNYNKALEIIYDYEDLINEYNFDKSKIAPSELFLGEIYFYKKDYKRAAEYFESTKTILADSKSYYKSYNLFFLTKTYFHLDLIQKGAQSFKEYTDLFNLHEASLEMRSHHFATFPDAMLDYFTEDKLIEIFNSDQISDDVTKINIGFVLASIYKENNEHLKSIPFWKFGIRQEEGFDNFNLYPLQNTYETYLELNEIDSAKYYLKLFQEASKDFYDLEKNKQFEEINTKYETAQKDLEIRKTKSAKNRITTTLLLTSVIGISLFYFFLSRLRNKKILAEKEVEIRNQKITDLEKEKKLISMTSILEGQEAERIRIAKDLHDGLGGLLSTVKVHIGNLEDEIQKNENLKIFNKTNNMIDEACQEVRRISHNLMPGALRLEGLKSAVEGLAEDLTDIHPFAVRTEFIGFNGQLDEKVEVFIYRIIQESLNNIIKYAQAKSVLIQLVENQDNYNLFVEDDGIGFDITSVEKGLGLKSMRSRIEYLNGHFDISSKIGEGTTISINIPKINKHE